MAHVIPVVSKGAVLKILIGVIVPQPLPEIKFQPFFFFSICAVAVVHSRKIASPKNILVSINMCDYDSEETPTVIILQQLICSKLHITNYFFVTYDVLIYLCMFAV